jgi:site-specific recombinase XerD
MRIIQQWRQEIKMKDEYRKYEEACERIREKNKQLLSDFASWLRQKGLAEKTIRQHTQNIDFYINEYLLYEDAQEAAEGVGQAGMFLGYWFIKKAAWSSAASIRSNAASLKKFYDFMQARGLVDEESVRDLRETLREGMPEWLGTMDRYDDPSITDPKDIWGL